MAISNPVDKYSTDGAETASYSTNTLAQHVAITAGSGPTQN